MAIDSLDPVKKTSHRLHHDLESLLYVIIWICTVQSGPNNRRRSKSAYSYDKTELFTWNAGKGAATAIRTVYDTKSVVMTNEGNFESLIIMKMDVYFDALKDCIREMRKILFPASLVVLANIPDVNLIFDETQDNVFLELSGAASADASGRMGFTCKSPPHLRDQDRLAAEFISVLDKTIVKLERVPEPTPMDGPPSDSPPEEIVLMRIIDLNEVAEGMAVDEDGMATGSSKLASFDPRTIALATNSSIVGGSVELIASINGIFDTLLVH